MNNIKLISLKMGQVNIHFKNGLNYILGGNASGKTTIFNCIRYSLGLDKSFTHNSFSNIELNIAFNEREICCSREIGSALIRVNEKENIKEFKAQTLEWDNYLSVVA